MKQITILSILAECKDRQVTNRYIMEVLAQLPEMASSRETYERFGWDKEKVINQVIRDHSKDVNVLLQRMKKFGLIKMKPIKKCDKKIGLTDQKMLYTLTKTGIKEIEKIKEQKSI
jgi:hypothetical protein